MKILLSESAVRKYVDEYIDFIKDCLLRFEVYCALRLGNSQEDYERWLGALELGYEQLVRDTPSLGNRVLRILIRQIAEILETGGTPDQIAGGCEVLLRRFLYVDENIFRRDYLDCRARLVARSAYSDHLVLKVEKLIEDANYDSAIVEVFKVLESNLRHLVQPASHMHGQNLLRKAFSGDEGTLKIVGGPGEQKALADFAAGVFGHFRNPSAHKHVFNPDLETLVKILTSKEQPLTYHDELTAQTVIAVAALLLKSSTILAIQNNLINEDERGRCPFGSA
jgi:uncharacterized protein (TIGR02391 family)